MKTKEGDCWNHVPKQYKEVGSHAHMEEWAMDRAMAGGSSLTGGKVGRKLWRWELCEMGTRSQAESEGREGSVGGLRREEWSEIAI